MKTIDRIRSAFYRSLRQAAGIVAVSLAVFCSETAQAQTGAGVQITGTLANFDVRYPASLPNDIEIYLYGDGLAVTDVVGTWNTNILLGSPPGGLQWGQASSITASVNNDPTSPAFGLNCVVIRWVGPPRPALVGRLVHLGVRLRIGAVVAHQEVWWTINGQRILRPCDPHVTWICTTHGWLICIQNPNPVPIYVYGGRFFAIAPTARLPFLSELSTFTNPAQFGGTWQPLGLPGGQRVLCIPPWCRFYTRVQATNWRPIVFQIAARDVPETGEPGAFPLQNPTMPQPDDFNGEHGTMAIVTGRPTEQFTEDINSDGAVGQPDFNRLRSMFGRTSEDLNQTQ